MTHHTDAERAEFEAAIRATMHDAGEDHIAERLERWPDGAYKDRATGYAWWGYQKAARRAPAAPVQKGDYLDGVNIPRLREALTFLGRCNGVGEGEVANKLSEHVNSITRAVLTCKELLRQGAPAAPVPKGWKLVPDEANMTDEQAEAICRLANVCGGGAYGIYRAALAAAPHPPEADHIPDAGKMDTNVRNWMNAALSKDVACPACGLSGLHACPSASTAESQGADAVKALEKVLRAVQRHLPPERIGERETIAEIISIIDPWPLAKPPANETQHQIGSQAAYLPPVQDKHSTRKHLRANY